MSEAATTSAPTEKKPVQKTRVGVVTSAKMAKTIEAFKGELQKIRTGRAHPGILDQVHVDYYGSMVPISQVANVSLLDARTISVQPWEKGMGAKIEKAIRESDLGLNPTTVGQVIRIKNAPFTIVGWLEAKGSGSFGDDQDDILLLPYTSVMKRLSGDTKFRSLYVQAESPAAIADVQQQITELLRQRLRARRGCRRCVRRTPGGGIRRARSRRTCPGLPT